MQQGGGRVALVAGASGLVGSHLLPLLLEADEYTRVHALSRRPLPLEHPRLANRVLRFDQPLQTQLKGLSCHDAFCCLGTTLRTAGSEAAFRAVDHDLVMAFARVALAAGATRLVVVSSIGASPEARNFYLRVKGETERDLQALQPASLDLLQPSLLLGFRRERRPLEVLAQGLMWAVRPLLAGRWSQYRAVDAALVAAAMRGAARSGRRGVYRYGYADFARLAALTRPLTA
jgi:uncharacterized protein YbjT (DUF2867 family)